MTGLHIKRIGVFILLTVLNVAWSMPVEAQNKGVAGYGHQSQRAAQNKGVAGYGHQSQKAAQKAAQKQQKEYAKAARKRQKTLKKYEEKQRRATKKASSNAAKNANHHSHSVSR